MLRPGGSPPVDAGVDRRFLWKVLRARAQHHPKKLAFLFLGHDGGEQARWTFADLDLRARRVAAHLQGLTAVSKAAKSRAAKSRAESRGERCRALLVYPPGLEFLAGFFGCLYADVVPVPVPVPQHAAQGSRLAAVIRQAAPAWLLTTSAAATTAAGAGLRNIGGEIAALAAHGLVASDAVDAAASDWRAPRTRPTDVAFLQFTSGSTARPKGVRVTHASLSWNSHSLSERFAHCADSVMVTWLPPFHDMGLIYALLEPVFGGFPCVVQAPFSFLRRPLGWLEAISRYRGTHSAAPNFAYELCVRRTSPRRRRGLDLSNWLVALNGSEPVRWETLERFADAFRCAGFRWQAFNPAYGLAEATVMVSGHAATQPPRQRLAPPEVGGRTAAARKIVSVGRPADSLEVRIVDPHSRTVCADGTVGEIWVRGPSVAAGYWHDATATRSTFAASLPPAEVSDEAPDEIPDEDGGFLRTGDLGFLEAGELHITGRLKDLLVLSGQNHYPQDIEATAAASHDAVRSGAVVALAVDVAGEERLVIVAALAASERRQGGRASVAEEVIGAIRQAVAAQHGVRVHHIELVAAGEIPRTSSGKLQRRQCRDRFLNGVLARQPRLARAM